METAIESRALIERGIRHAACDMLLDERFTEPLRVRVKPGFDTACWYFDKHSGHHVYVGTGVLARARDGLDEHQLARYVGRFVHHERAHAMFTERDGAKVKAWLDAVGVPFALYNLVEDGRIEKKYECGSDGEFTFAWREFERSEVLEAVSTGGLLAGVFFKLIQAGGDVQTVAGEVEGSAAEAVLEDATQFYRCATQAECSEQAVVVAREMLKRYPELSQMGDRGRCSLQLGAELQGDAQAAAAFDQDALSADEAGGDESAEREKRESARHTSSGGGEGGGATQQNLLSETRERSMDKTRIKALAARLERLAAKERHVRGTTATPRQRVSVKHVLQMQPRWIGPVKVLSPGRARRVALFVDVSGSMEGAPLEGAAYLVAGLSELAQRGLIGGDVILSTTRSDGDGSAWMHKRLPWSIDDCCRIRTHGGEGLAETLRAHDRKIEAADIAIVVTDGYIGGPRIAHAEYRARGLTVVGGYVSDGTMDIEQVAQQMSLHFDKLLVRGSVEALAEAVTTVALREVQEAT